MYAYENMMNKWMNSSSLCFQEDFPALNCRDVVLYGPKKIPLRLKSVLNTFKLMNK
jgi:hypothetical protein